MLRLADSMGTNDNLSFWQFLKFILNGRTDNRVLVHLRGGDLRIEYDEKTNHLLMTGPATEVFEGEIQIN